MRGVPGRSLPSLGECLEANLRAAKLTSPDVVAVGVAMNTSRLDQLEAGRACAEAEDALGLPCQDPIAMGVDRLVDSLLQRCGEGAECETFERK
jgi:uncharacterized NAD-dependent epimerase/dehydratase family protein